MKRRSGSLSQHIASSSQLAQLRRQAERLGEASRALDTHLGAALAGRASVARLEAREVVLVSDSAAWATRLRFLAPDLGQFFARYLGLTEPPRIRVHVGRPRAQVKTPERPPLSHAGASVLEQAGSYLEDERLAAVLKRLATRVAGGGEP